MRQYVVKKSSLKGRVRVPPSKSHTLRAILFGALGKGKSLIENHLPSSDTAAMVEACIKLGAKVDQEAHKIEIEGIDGDVSHAEDVICAKNSGIVLRFLAAVGGLGTHPFVITGDHSIRYRRPIKPLLMSLKQLGVSTQSMRGDHFAPVIIQGPMVGGKAIVDGEDSQTISALLIASALSENPVEIEVNNPGEKPWVALTLDWFDKLGISYEHQNFEKYSLKGKSKFQGFHYHVPGDFSSAAFPIAAALVTGSDLIIENLDMEDVQGDKKLINIFQQMGADISYDKHLHVKKSSLKGITIDINDCIDAITILAVVACYAEGETRILNGAVARKKECDRIMAITKELKKMGANIEEKEDGLHIYPSPLFGAHVHSHHDHRMVMSLAVAGMGATGETIIDEVSCVAKTYPTFLSDFTHIGANIYGK